MKTLAVGDVQTSSTAEPDCDARCDHPQPRSAADVHVARGEIVSPWPYRECRSAAPNRSAQLRLQLRGGKDSRLLLANKSVVGFPNADQENQLRDQKARGRGSCGSCCGRTGGEGAVGR